jgi:transcriptional regulator with XRE-family HTH domain
MTEQESSVRRPGVGEPSPEDRTYQPTEITSDMVAARLQQLRKQRGWSARKLAEACAAVGSPQLTESVIANIETGRRDRNGRRRRDVTVDEVGAFAKALNVSVALLLWPAVTPTEAMLMRFDSAAEQREFLRQIEALLVRIRDEFTPLEPQESGDG